MLKKKWPVCAHTSTVASPAICELVRVSLKLLTKKYLTFAPILHVEWFENKVHHCLQCVCSYFYCCFASYL
jgi:hypothetical protein